MIELIPAIDIIDGRCVRLTKGDYNEKTVYDASPAEMAKKFEALGFKRLHVVDLDGAKSKHVVNLKTLKNITSETNLTIDFGGGIKTDADIEAAFENGAAMVTVGSIAATERELFLKWLGKYGSDKIILGADVKDGKISINGWKENTEEDIISFLKFYVKHGIKNVLCTDISKDGTLTGPSHELYKQIIEAFPGINLIASGGVSSIGDIKRLNAEGLHSVVFGKAIYEGKVDLNDLVSRMKKETL